MELKIEELSQLLTGVEFDKLENCLSNLAFDDMADWIKQLALIASDDHSELILYAFLTKLIHQNETSGMHWLASQIMGVFLNYVDGAEQVGLFHGLMASKLDPENADIYEFLLYFNHIPERILDDERAILFAQKVIAVNPASPAAQMTLGKLR
jgi:hypothetical protein